MKKVLSIVSLVFILSCENDSTTKKIANTSVKYAQGFTIEQIEDYQLLTLRDAWRGENTRYQYLLYKNEEPEGYDNTIKVKIPITSIACMSLTHMSFIEALGQEKSIVAASGCNYSSSPKIIERISGDYIVEIGGEQTINYELLIERNPDLIMAYGIDEASLKYIAKLKSTGLKTVLNAEYMEVHPLGKAEWIKFVAAFYDMENEANEIFRQIEKEYNQLAELTKNVKQKPTVFVNMPWSGNWHVAGGASFQNQLFKDAGADYIWSDNNEKSSIIKSKEQVIEDAYETDFWLNLNLYESIESILDYDSRLDGFKAIKTKQIYNNNNRLNQYGGNDYWESGTLNPHIVLKDLIKIFHPDLIEHQLYYYKKLE